LTQGYLFAQSHEKNNHRLSRMLKKESVFDDILDNPNVFQVQIIYTQINREKNNTNFIDHYYNVNVNKYFYPSNTVFLPIAALTLEKINSLAKEHNINKDRYVRVDNALTQEIMMYHDSLSVNNYVSFAHFIKKMFVLGDKMAFNCCYDFLDQRYLNERMHSLGYNNSWFLHRLDNKAPEDSRQSNIITFFQTNVQSYYIDIVHLKRHPTIIPFYSIYVKKGEYNPVDYYSGRGRVPMGKGFVHDGHVIDSTFDFSRRNKFTIEDMHNFLKQLIFPEVHKNKLNLSDDDYAFLYKQMLANDANLNYFMNDRLSDSTIKIFNNPGKDAGFMIDNAYIIDTRNGIDFFLTVVIKCNRADIFGDEYYEYQETGLSFMKNISSFIHQYEIGRKRQSVNFDEFLNKIK
jgi:hypothetical protein